MENNGVQLPTNAGQIFRPETSEIMYVYDRLRISYLQHDVICAGTGRGMAALRKRCTVFTRSIDAHDMQGHPERDDAAPRRAVQHQLPQC